MDNPLKYFSELRDPRVELNGRRYRGWCASRANVSPNRKLPPSQQLLGSAKKECFSLGAKNL
jgi:hypothetical protein